MADFVKIDVPKDGGHLIYEGTTLRTYGIFVVKGGFTQVIINDHTGAEKDLGTLGGADGSLTIESNKVMLKKATAATTVIYTQLTQLAQRVMTFADFVRIEVPKGGGHLIYEGTTLRTYGIFVVKGRFDAVSIYDHTGTFISLGSLKAGASLTIESNKVMLDGATEDGTTMIYAQLAAS